MKRLLFLSFIISSCLPVSASPTADDLPTANARVVTMTPIPTAAIVPTPTATPTFDELIYPYTIEGLREHIYQNGKIHIRETLSENDDFTVYYIDYPSDGLTITGIMRIPVGEGSFPVIVMNHGYYNRADFYSGDGTDRAAEVLAKRGYITLSSDYRSWGDSDIGHSFFYSGLAIDIVNLLYAIPSIEQADPERIGIWGHSMGGGVTMKVLAILGGMDGESAIRLSVTPPATATDDVIRLSVTQSATATDNAIRLSDTPPATATDDAIRLSATPSVTSSVTPSVTQSATPNSQLATSTPQSKNSSFHLYPSSLNVSAAVLYSTVSADFADIIERWGMGCFGDIAAGEKIIGCNSSDVIPASLPYPLQDAYRFAASDADTLKKVSPIYYLADIPIPIQINYGTEDGKIIGGTPPEWSINLFAEFEKIGLGNAEIFAYEGQEHSFKADAWFAFMERTAQFFDKYVKGDGK